MRLSTPRRITSENAPPESQQMVESIASVINPFMEDVTKAINGNLDLDNIAFKLVRVDVIVDSKGLLKTSPDVNTGVLRAINAALCVNVINTINPNTSPDINAMPVVLFTPLGNGNIKMTKVLNLKENVKYTLVLLIL